MPKPEILGSPRSSYTRMVRMVCEEKGIDYVLTETLLGAPELHTIHPFGKMPVLRHGDFSLCESKAIASYLDRSFAGPQLIPWDPRSAALTEQWVSLVNTVMDRTLVRTYLFAHAFPRTADGKPDRNIIEAVLPAIWSASTSRLPTSICCRSCSTSGNCPKPRQRSRARPISAAITRPTRCGRVSSAPSRPRGHRGGRARHRGFRRPEIGSTGGNPRWFAPAMA
jgi:hypothetical protein